MSSGLATSSEGLVCEQGHRAFGEEAAFGGDLPFVVCFDQDGACEPEQGGGVGEHADDVGAAFDFLVEPLGWSTRTSSSAAGTQVSQPAPGLVDGLGDVAAQLSRQPDGEPGDQDRVLVVGLVE